MDEVDTVTFPNVSEEGGVLLEAQGVPADVRDLQIRRDHTLDGAHGAGDQAKAFVLAVFVAFVEQQLHSQADAQQRLAAGGQLFQYGVQPRFAELLRRVTESTYAGEEDLVRSFQNGRVGGNCYLHADGCEGAFQ